MFGYCEVDNETLSLIEIIEIFYRGFAAPKGFCSHELDAINKLILLWVSHGSEYQYYIILGYDIIILTNSDVS